MAEKINIAELDIDLDSLTSKQADLLNQITKLKSAQKELRAETDNLSDATEEQSKAYVKQDAELKKLNGEYSTNKKLLAEASTGVKGLSDALSAENKTLGDVKKNNKELRAIREQLDTTTEKGRKAIEQINAKIDENTKLTKANVSEIENQKINIGNYASALDRLVPGMGQFAEQLQASTVGAKLLRNALIAIPILAIATAVLGLVKAFAPTQRGMDAINKVLRPLTTGFDKLIGLIQNVALSLFDKLSEAINNPKQALQDLGQAIVDNVLNRFKALTVLGDAISKLLKGDFTGAAKTATDGIVQLTTGVTNATAKINDAAKAVGNFIDEAVSEGSRLDELIKRLEQRQVELEVPLAKARNELKRYKQEAEDVTRTEAERLESLQKAVAAQEFITKGQQELKDLAIERKELENTFNDTSREDELELQKLIAERYELETAGIENLTTLQNLRNTIANQARTKATAAFQEQLKQEEERLKESLARRQEIYNEFEEAKRYAQTLRFEEELFLMEEQGASEFAIKMAQLNQQEQLEIEAVHRRIERGEASQREITLIEKQFASARVDLKRQEEAAKYSLARSTANDVAQIFGEQSELAKAATLFQISLDTAEAISGLTAASEQNPANAITFGGAGVAQFISGIARIFANVNKARNVLSSKPKIPRFEKGGLQEVGGKRHIEGGTKFYGEDGTTFEAERGELIGVLSRSAAKKFMDFNDNPNIYTSMLMNGIGNNVRFSDRGIIGAVKENTRVLKGKPVPQTNLTKDGLYTIVTDGQNSKKLNHDYYVR